MHTWSTSNELNNNKKGKFQVSSKKNHSGKVLGDKAFLIASNQQYDGYHRGLALIIYEFFDEKSREATAHTGIRIGISDDQQLANKLHRPINRKFQRCKVYLSCWYNQYLDTDLADLKLISEYNKDFNFLLCVIEIYSNYAWAFQLKDSKCITNYNGFHKVLIDSAHKPNR